MLVKLEVVNSRGSVLDLPLSDENVSFFVQLIEGLDPVAATLVSSSFANLDGAQYNTSRREPRNIKLQLGLEPDYALTSVHLLRRQLYDFFMPKTEVKLRFNWFNEFDTNVITQNIVVEIMARVESTPTAIFSNEPVADISLVCYDPDFIVPEPVVFLGQSTPGLDELVINYDGTVETGITFIIRPERDLDAFTVYHRPPDGTLRMLDFTYPLLDGDILTINTTVGQKSVVRTRDGVESSVLYAQSPQSDWLELQPGPNILRVYATGGPVLFEIDYIVRLGGL